MTVCIAAICDADGAMITSCDKMISMGSYFSGDDMARKIDFIRRDWTAMFAGDDISPAIPILERIRGDAASGEDTRSNIVKSVRNAYRSQRLEQIEDEILSSHGFTWQEFKDRGKIELTDRVHEKILDQIRDYHLSLQFLVSGFDNKKVGHIFTIESPGRIEHYDKLSFWAIGSGQHQAIASLFANHYNRYEALEKCVAKVIAAKFMAESAPGVGKDTATVVFWHSEMNLQLVPTSTHANYRLQWEALPKLPSAMLPEIKQAIEEGKQKDRAQAAASKALPPAQRPQG